jgi:hypothetical protein
MCSSFRTVRGEVVAAAGGMAAAVGAETLSEAEVVAEVLAAAVAVDGAVTSAWALAQPSLADLRSPKLLALVVAARVEMLGIVATNAIDRSKQIPVCIRDMTAFGGSARISADPECLNYKVIVEFSAMESVMLPTEAAVAVFKTHDGAEAAIKQPA